MSQQTLYQRLSKSKTPNLIAAAILVILVSQPVIIFLLIFQGSLLVQVKNKPAPTLVELSDGSSIKVGAIGSLERSNATIKKFVKQNLSLLFTWNGQLSKTEKGQKIIVPDPGVQVNDGVLVTTSTWVGSFSLESDFQKSLLKEIAALTPEGVFQRKKQVLLNISKLGEPVSIAPGEWTVEMIASLDAYEGSLPQKIIRFNKQIYLRAIEPPTEEVIAPTELQKLIKTIRGTGLEIYLIKDLSEKDSQIDN